MFLSLASKPRSTVSSNLASKPIAMIFVVWPQNHSLVIRFGHQNRHLRFGDLTHKIKLAMVCRLRLKINGMTNMTRGMRLNLASCFA
jgi:hypothetical protein